MLRVLDHTLRTIALGQTLECSNQAEEGPEKATKKKPVR